MTPAQKLLPSACAHVPEALLRVLNPHRDIASHLCQQLFRRPTDSGPLSSPLVAQMLSASVATCGSCYFPVVDFVLGFLTTQSNFPAFISFSVLGI